MRGGLLFAALALGCGKAEPLCPEPSATLAQAGGTALTCAEAQPALDYIAVLALRPVPGADRERVMAAIGARFGADPQGTRDDLAAATAAVEGMRGSSGLAAAELRSHRLYEAFKRRGPLVGTDDAVVSTLSRTAKLWVSDDATELALTELDVEGWLKYGSLCREVQGGGPLKLSIADRVPSYQVVEGLFKAGPRDQQVALAAMGPFWPQVKQRWAAATYDEQQAWIAAAPLPPPMTASSLGYFEAVLEAPPAVHAARLHDALGPLQIAEDP